MSSNGGGVAPYKGVDYYGLLNISKDVRNFIYYLVMLFLLHQK